MGVKRTEYIIPQGWNVIKIVGSQVFSVDRDNHLLETNIKELGASHEFAVRSRVLASLEGGTIVRVSDDGQVLAWVGNGVLYHMIQRNELIQQYELKDYMQMTGNNEFYVEAISYNGSHIILRDANSTTVYMLEFKTKMTVQINEKNNYMFTCTFVMCGDVLNLLSVWHEKDTTIISLLDTKSALKKSCQFPFTVGAVIGGNVVYGEESKFRPTFVSLTTHSGGSIGSGNYMCHVIPWTKFYEYVCNNKCPIDSTLQPLRTASVPGLNHVAGDTVIFNDTPGYIDSGWQVDSGIKLRQRPVPGSFTDHDGEIYGAYCITTDSCLIFVY